MRYERYSYRTWHVFPEKDEEDDTRYTVGYDHRGWHCDCFYFSVKKKYCSHIKFVIEGEGFEKN